MDLEVDTGATIVLGAVDDHPVVLAGLRAEIDRLDSSIRFDVTAASVVDLLAAQTAFDVVLLDLRLQDGSQPADNVTRLLSVGTRVLVYTEGGSRTAIEQALAAGASGIVRKDRSPSVLAEAVRAVAGSGVFDSEELAQALDGVHALAPQLSERERQVLRLYASGLPAKLVARRLGVGLATAREYLKRIKAKYAAMERPAPTRLDLYQRAVEDGLLDPVQGL